MNTINTELLTALQELILMAESMDGCKGIHWKNAKKAVRNAESALANPPIPEPAVGLADSMPPVPDGYRLAGRLRDYEGSIRCRALVAGEWTPDIHYFGMKDEPDSPSADWRVAVKI